MEKSITFSGLIYDTFSVTDYTGLNGRMIDELRGF
jgi:hypothetical protein